MVSIHHVTAHLTNQKQAFSRMYCAIQTAFCGEVVLSSVGGIKINSVGGAQCLSVSFAKQQKRGVINLSNNIP